MATKKITSVSELIETLGGPTKAGKVLGGASTQLTWNWAQRGKLPTERYLEQKAILDGLGIQVPDTFWFAPKTEGAAA